MGVSGAHFKGISKALLPIGTEENLCRNGICAFAISDFADALYFFCLQS